jgi:hypothetical protein
MFHVVLVQKLVYNLHSRQFDIVTAFLYGLLDEEIYVEFPEGYEMFLKENHGKTSPVRPIVFSELFMS